jgi:hypothetical protein
MDIGSLVLALALTGQTRQRAADASQAAQQEADPDTSIEEADEAAVEDDAAPPGMAQKGAGAPAGADRKAPGGQPDAGSTDVEPAEPITPLHSMLPKPGTADALLKWLAGGDAALDGKRVALVDLLSRVYDRSQQAILIASYWKLSAAVAEYRIAADESSRLEQLLSPADAADKHASDPVLEARLAGGEARLREAELAMVTQQFALAEQMRLPANEPLPLADDLPHAGAYRTSFERFARVAPPRSHLLDRTLPLLHRSVELRAAAALSAADSADAETEAYHTGQLDLLSAVDSVSELTRQRRAFVAAVRDYNLDIAEYALSVAPASLTSTQLVGMLIGPPRTVSPANTAPPKQVAEQPGGVKPARFDAPLGGTSSASGTPTLAPPQAGSRRSPRGQQRGAGGEAPSGSSPDTGRRRPANAPADQSGQAKPVIKSISPSTTSRRDNLTRRYFTARPPSDLATADETQPAAGANGAGVEQGIYSGLADLSPIKRAQELSATLHWDRQITADDGTPTTLIDALAATAGLDKRTLIEAYWQGREQIAAAAAVKQEAELLKSLQSAALASHSQPGGAEAMLRLRTAQLSADAAEEEATIGVLTAQFNLAQLMRRPLTSSWPWPITPPHAGGYQLRLDEQSTAVQQTSLVRQVSKAIPLRHEVLQQRADAVVAADAARAEVILGFEAGQRRVSDALASVRQLTTDTLAFLDAQTQYNIQFADYVMAVAPPGTPDATLAGVLVVKR